MSPPEPGAQARTSWRCRLRWHRFTKVRSPESTDAAPYYLRCERCGYERDLPSTPPMDASGG